MALVTPAAAPWGRRPQRFEAARRILLALAVAAALPGDIAARQEHGAAVVHGQVVDAVGGAGVQGVEVRLDGTSLRAATDSDGRFLLRGVPAGRHALRLRRIGYGTRTDTLDVPPNASVEVSLTIAQEAIPLEGIEVSVRSLLLERHGFYDRRSQGFRGFFMDRPAIESRDPLYVADLFRTIPGVEVVNGSRLIMSQSVTLRGGGRGCEPSLWLDGARSGLRNYDHLKPEHVEGIEVYTGGGAPGKYNDLCGTVVIWTRVPVRR